jgi:hypothetical protein
LAKVAKKTQAPAAALAAPASGAAQSQQTSTQQPVNAGGTGPVPQAPPEQILAAATAVSGVPMPVGNVATAGVSSLAQLEGDVFNQLANDRNGTTAAMAAGGAPTGGSVAGGASAADAADGAAATGKKGKKGGAKEAAGAAAEMVGKEASKKLNKKSDDEVDSEAVAKKPKGKVTVKGQSASSSQLKVLHDVIATVVEESKKKHLSAKETEAAAVSSIAMVTQESGAQNLKGGDADSVGVAQQRTSLGVYRDPGNVVTAIQDFVNGPKDGSGGLFDVIGKAVSGDIAGAVQTVQRSAFPDAYAQWEGEARKTYAAFTGGSTTGGKKTK